MVSITEPSMAGEAFGFCPCKNPACTFMDQNLCVTLQDIMCLMQHVFDL